MIVSNRIAEYRKKAGLSQPQLAKLAKCSVRTIWSVENYRVVPTMFIAIHLSRALETPVDELFYIQD